MDAALNPFPQPPGSGQLEAFIISAVRQRIGEKDAIPTSRLTSQAAALLGKPIDERTVRDTIHALRQRGLPSNSLTVRLALRELLKRLEGDQAAPGADRSLTAPNEQG